MSLIVIYPKYQHKRIMSPPHWVNPIVAKGPTPEELAQPYSKELGWILPDIENPQYRPPKAEQFKPAHKGGITTCTLSIDSIDFVGVANCSLSDGFSYALGRKIALSRAVFNAQKSGVNCYLAGKLVYSAGKEHKTPVVVVQQSRSSQALAALLANGQQLTRMGIKSMKEQADLDIDFVVVE